ncbi:MAG: pilus assembly protein TadG-related protein [Anaerolineaceae bacterium]
MKNKINFEKGQIIVIFVVALVAMLVIGALLLDGGMTYMNRRAAQTAADAGALAGAHEYCYYGATNVESVAVQYAEVENYSSNAIATLDAATTSVTVDVIITRASFLAQLFGRSQTTVQASATAGCFHPGSAEHLIPIAWSCRAPVTDSISGKCQEKGLDWPTQMKPLIDGKDINGDPVPVVTINGVDYYTPYNFGKNGGIVDNKIYIIMDSDKAGIDHCKEIPGGGDELTCDLDGDGAIDLLGSGDRSWLDLDELNLKKSIEKFYAQELGIHTWAPGQTGVNAAVLDTIDDVIISASKVVMVPVVNAVCPKDVGVNSTQCQNLAHTGDTGLPLEPGETDTLISGNGNTYFHIVGFAPFYVTCVRKGGNDKCPGHNWAVNAGNMKDNVKTIEGYFVDNYPVDLAYGTGGIDLGVNVISLTR